MAKFTQNDMGKKLKKGAIYSGSIFIFLGSLVKLATGYIDGKHMEEMTKLQYQYAIFQKDSAHRSEQEIWQNNKNDCIEETEDSLIKHHKNCN